MITHEKSLESFSEQIDYVLQNYVRHDISDIDNIVLGGLGGSGIGAEFTRTFFYEVSDKNITVVSDYHLPNYVNTKTLLVLASYSGDTEETLHMLEEGLQAGCKIICITSGGVLASTAKENNIPLYNVPDGYQPRMAFGYSCSYNMLIVAEALGLDGIMSELKQSVEKFKEAADWKKQAEQLADFYGNTLDNKFVIVADRNAQPTAVRLAQQIQENAKLEAYVNVLPENNHNALETYYTSVPSNILILDGNSNERVNLRFKFFKSILSKYNIPFSSITFDGAVVSEIFKTVHILDWFSIFVSNKVNADNMQVKNISELKTFLKEN
jgi:glucose/mannose-6-phosphate isomerase